MTEQLLKTMDEDLMLDTPFLRRVRERGRVEGLAMALIALREGVLEALTVRFDPPATYYQRIEAQLGTVNNVSRLRNLLRAALRAANPADFEQALAS